MMKVVMSARTVSIAKQYNVQQLTRQDGSQDSIRSIYFRIAVRREYHKSNGEYETDFFLAKATGPVADILNKNCTATRADGKLASRHLLLTGAFETYTKQRTFNTNINGTVYTVPFEDRNNFVFVIEHVEFLDRKDGNNGNGTGNATWVPGAQVMPQAAVPVAQAPVAQAVPVAAPAQAVPVAQAVAPVQVVQPAPAAQAIPVAPIQGAPQEQAVPAPAVTPMNIPEANGNVVGPW